MEGADAKPIFHKGSELSIAAVLQIRKFVQSFQDMKGKKTDLPFFAGCSVQTADGTGSEVAGIPVRPAVTADQRVFQTFKAAFVDKSFSGDFEMSLVGDGHGHIAEGGNIVCDNLKSAGFPFRKEITSRRDFVLSRESRGISCFTVGRLLTTWYPTVWVGELLKMIPVSASRRTSSS